VRGLCESGQPGATRQQPLAQWVGVGRCAASRWAGGRTLAARPAEIQPRIPSRARARAELSERSEESEDLWFWIWFWLAFVWRTHWVCRRNPTLSEGIVATKGVMAAAPRFIERLCPVYQSEYPLFMPEDYHDPPPHKLPSFIRVPNGDSGIKKAPRGGVFFAREDLEQRQVSVLRGLVQAVVVAQQPARRGGLRGLAEVSRKGLELDRNLDHHREVLAVDLAHRAQ